MINRGHDLGADHRTAVFAGEERSGPKKIFVRTTRLKLHKPNESIVVDAGGQVFFRVVEPRHVFLGQINAAVGEIFRHVTQDVGDLESEPKLDRIFAAGRILVTKNFNADQANGARDAVTILAQVRECFVARDGQVHFHAVHDLLQHRRSNRVSVDQAAYFRCEGRLRRDWNVEGLPPEG